MPLSEWKVPKSVQPRPEDFAFDLDRVLGAVMALTSRIPGDAFTADTLGTERAGNGVLIDASGLVLTIGYLITEAESVWLTANDGSVVPADVVGYDGESGFGLVQALGRLRAQPIPFGESGPTKVGDKVLVAGAGGRSRSIVGRVAAKQEFAGYWEYLLDEAIFTAPSHPHWGGTAVVSEDGHLLGIGSLQLQQESSRGRSENINMVVPIDLLKPVMHDIQTIGRPNRPPRPWLGFFATEIDGQVAIAGLSDDGPASQAGLQIGDLVVAVAGEEVGDLAALFRAVWALGQAGVEVPIRIRRGERGFDLTIQSVDRRSLLKGHILH